jgi:hypothetical protein
MGKNNNHMDFQQYDATDVTISTPDIQQEPPPPPPPPLSVHTLNLKNNDVLVSSICEIQQQPFLPEDMTDDAINTMLQTLADPRTVSTTLDTISKITTRVHRYCEEQAVLDPDVAKGRSERCPPPQITGAFLSVIKCIEMVSNSGGNPERLLGNGSMLIDAVYGMGCIVQRIPSEESRQRQKTTNISNANHTVWWSETNDTSDPVIEPINIRVFKACRYPIMGLVLILRMYRVFWKLFESLVLLILIIISLDNTTVELIRDHLNQILGVTISVLVVRLILRWRIRLQNIYMKKEA